MNTEIIPPVPVPQTVAGQGANAWLNKGLLAVGALLLASGLISFFAFNWNAMSPALKFAVLFAVVVGGALLALRLQGMSRKASLFGAFIGTRRVAGHDRADISNRC